MIKIAICDDIKSDVKLIQNYLNNFLKSTYEEYYIDCFYSGEEFISKGLTYDIIFLDIEMRNLNGIEIGKIIKKISLKSQIIYVTNHNSYWFEALNIHAFQYILKPIREESIIKSIKDFIKYVANMNEKDTVTIDVNGELIKISSNEVLYFEFIDRKVKIVSLNRISYIRSSMKNIYNQVKEKNFGMPHKAFIINFYFLKGIKGYEALMQNGDKIPISQKKAAKFKSEFYDFLYITYNFYN